MKGKRHIQSFNEHQENLNISDESDSNLKSLIEQYFEENLVGKFGYEDGEFVKEIIRDFVKFYYH